MTHRRTWQKQETRVAKILLGKRIPSSGSAQFEGEEGDVLHPHIEIECKLRAGLPVGAWYKETMKRAARSHKFPLLVVRKKGMHEGDLAVINLLDFAALWRLSDLVTQRMTAPISLASGKPGVLFTMDELTKICFEVTNRGDSEEENQGPDSS